MKAIHITSLIARMALMLTMILGLLFWLAHLPVLSALLTLLSSIGFTTIHEAFGFVGVLLLLVLSIVALFTRGVRLLGLVGVLYAFILPTLGLTQMLILVGNLHWLIQIAHLLVGIGAMYLLLGMEKRYRFRLSRHEAAEPVGHTLPGLR